jgi:hypothetical protein
MILGCRVDQKVSVNCWMRSRRMSQVPWNFGGGPVSIRLRSPRHCARRGRQVRDFTLQRCAKRCQVPVAVDAAELLAGLDHRGGAPAQCHLPGAPALDVTGVVVRASEGGTFRRSTVSVSSRPSRRLAAAPGWVRSSSLARASRAASASTADPAWTVWRTPRHLPHGRPRAGDRHLNVYETRDNLARRANRYNGHQGVVEMVC